jgi:hypothetical protein
LAEQNKARAGEGQQQLEREILSNDAAATAALDAKFGGEYR